MTKLPSVSNGVQRSENKHKTRRGNDGSVPIAPNVLKEVLREQQNLGLGSGSGGPQAQCARPYH